MIIRAICIGILFGVAQTASALHCQKPAESAKAKCEADRKQAASEVAAAEKKAGDSKDKSQASALLALVQTAKAKLDKQNAVCVEALGTAATKCDQVKAEADKNAAAAAEYRQKAEVSEEKGLAAVAEVEKKDQEVTKQKTEVIQVEQRPDSNAKSQQLNGLSNLISTLMNQMTTKGQEADTHLDNAMEFRSKAEALEALATKQTKDAEVGESQVTKGAEDETDHFTKSHAKLDELKANAAAIDDGTGHGSKVKTASSATGGDPVDEPVSRGGGGGGGSGDTGGGNLGGNFSGPTASAGNTNAGNAANNAPSNSAAPSASSEDDSNTGSPSRSSSGSPSNSDSDSKNTDKKESPSIFDSISKMFGGGNKSESNSNSQLPNLNDPAQAAQDCRNGGTELVCVCQKNPRDLRCRGTADAQAAGAADERTKKDKVSNSAPDIRNPRNDARLQNDKFSSSSPSLEQKTGMSGKVGAGSGTGSGRGGQGGYASGNDSRSTYGSNGYYRGSSGSSGAFAAQGVPPGSQIANGYFLDNRSRKWIPLPKRGPPSLAAYLPKVGGTRTPSSVISRDGITGPHTNQFQKMRIRYAEVFKQP